MTEECFNWLDLIDFIEELLLDPSASQAALRAANSRAYYAARGIATDLLWQKHQFKTKNNRVLMDTLEKFYPEPSAVLRRLWDSRIQADYRTETKHTRAGAQLNCIQNGLPYCNQGIFGLQIFNR